MGLAGQNQVRHMYVGVAPAAHTTLAELAAGAVGDVLLLSADGTAVGAGKPFKLYQLSAKGIISSDTIEPETVSHSNSVAFTAAVLGIDTISALTVDINTLYTVQVSVSGFGSMSPEDEYLKKGFYKAVTGNTQENIVDGLIASLNRNFSREPGASASSNPYFTFSKTGTGAGAALVITEKVEWKQGFNGDQLSNHVLDYSVEAFFTTAPTITATAVSSAGKGTGYQVVEMEQYLLGERGDFYRKAGYPHNLSGAVKPYSSVSGEYDIIEIAYSSEGRDEAKKSKKGLTLAMPTAAVPNANVNGLVADLNTILGAGSVNTIKAV